MKQTFKLLALASVLTLAACNNGGDPQDGNDNGGGTAPQPASTTLSALVHQMFAATSDTALPVEIDALSITTDEDVTGQYTNLLI